VLEARNLHSLSYDLDLKMSEVYPPINVLELPDELLTQIVLMGGSNVVSVCRRFRQIVIENRQLWIRAAIWGDTSSITFLFSRSGGWRGYKAPVGYNRAYVIYKDTSQAVRVVVFPIREGNDIGPSVDALGLSLDSSNVLFAGMGRFTVLTHFIQSKVDADGKGCVLRLPPHAATEGKKADEFGSLLVFFFFQPEGSATVSGASRTSSKSGITCAEFSDSAVCSIRREGAGRILRARFVFSDNGELDVTPLLQQHVRITHGHDLSRNPSIRCEYVSLSRAADMLSVGHGADPAARAIAELAAQLAQPVYVDVEWERSLSELDDSAEAVVCSARFAASQPVRIPQAVVIVSASVRGVDCTEQVRKDVAESSGALVVSQREGYRFVYRLEGSSVVRTVQVMDRTQTLVEGGWLVQSPFIWR
jgi:hypothetical protein